MAPYLHKTIEDRLLSIWFALGLILALFVGTGAGILGWLSGQVVAAAVLTGATAFGGTTSLVVLIIKTLRTDQLPSDDNR